MNGFLSRVLKPAQESIMVEPRIDKNAIACKEIHARILRAKHVFNGLLTLFPDEKPGSKVIELDTAGRVVVHHVSPLEIGGSLIQGKERTYLNLVASSELSTISLQTPTEGLTVVQFCDEDAGNVRVTVADTNTPTMSEVCKSRIERIETLANLFGEVALGPVA